MLKGRAIEDAKWIAKNAGITIAVCYAPIETAEEEGDWGYCPANIVEYLFAQGSVRYHILPNGEVV